MPLFRITISLLTPVYPPLGDDGNFILAVKQSWQSAVPKHAEKRLTLQGLIPGHSGGVHTHHVLHSSLKRLDHRASGMGSYGSGTVVGGVEGVLHPNAVGLDPGPVGPCPTPGTNPDIPACWYTSGGAHSYR